MPANEIVRSRCASCGATLELECEPIQGFYGYKTFNEYFCPKCAKRNVVLSPGAVLTSRVSEAGSTTSA